ncbi:hypothetical protein DOTSEDRAFT_37064 [Dothistroma septosporum NZE10]|uniref:Uncharacterized protein n=1 Tax=Dothistroma septosporum (strain NZE10 / CBS 128990) TaxID=675120 RepID=N1PJL5_DOTSN|nr:hypothetical protein DOTSEDRAFT_37064 [Dothistroma septosporum NZE10]
MSNMKVASAIIALAGVAAAQHAVSQIHNTADGQIQAATTAVTGDSVSLGSDSSGPSGSGSDSGNGSDSGSNAAAQPTYAAVSSAGQAAAPSYAFGQESGVAGQGAAGAGGAAATGAVVTQIDDGQIQAPTSAAGGSESGAQPSSEAGLESGAGASSSSTGSGSSGSTGSGSFGSGPSSGASANGTGSGAYPSTSVTPYTGAGVKVAASGVAILAGIAAVFAITSSVAHGMVLNEENGIMSVWSIHRWQSKENAASEKRDPRHTLPVLTLHGYRFPPTQ